MYDVYGVHEIDTAAAHSSGRVVGEAKTVTMRLSRTLYRGHPNHLTPLVIILVMCAAP
jgi:hypothetical protein